jgi:hypothetical protein
MTDDSDLSPGDLDVKKNRAPGRAHFVPLSTDGADAVPYEFCGQGYTVEFQSAPATADTARGHDTGG